MSAIASGLLFGILGSGHCALMCGPIASLNVARRSRVGYHGGRLLTYLVLGTFAGAVGAGASAAGIGRVLAICSGLWLLVIALWRSKPHLSLSTGASKATSLLMKLARHGRAHSRWSSWTFGAANALLPCGLTYAAVIGAAGFGNTGDALLFLGAFGLGTVPGLALAGVAGPALLRRLPLRPGTAASVALAVVGLLLVVRGVADIHIHAAPRSATEHVHGSATRP